MRRWSQATKTDRHQDEALQDPDYRDEGLQVSPKSSTLPVPGAAAAPAPVSAVTEQDPNHEPELLHHPVVTFAPPAPITAVNALMTDAFPAGHATASSSAPTSATASATATTATSNTNSPYLYENSNVVDSGHSVIDQSDSDIDLDLDSNHDRVDSPFAPLQPSLLDDHQHNPIYPQHLDLDSDYMSNLPEDYDLDMSDSDGGAPLDEVSNTVSPIPQPVLQGHPFLANEDNHVQLPDPGSLNYLYQAAFDLSTLAGVGSIMDVPPPPALNPHEADNPPQNQQPMPQPVPQPAAPAPVAALANENWEDAPLVSNPNPTMLGSENLGLVDFLRHWAIQSRTAPPMSSARACAPCPRAIREQASRRIDEVRYSDLRGDCYDMQGMDWEHLDTTRDYARHKRFLTYKNYTNKEGSDKWTTQMPDAKIPITESFFRFRNLHVRSDVYLAHFQLRSVLACPSRTQVFYPGGRGINQINTVSKKTELALNLSRISGLGSIISTLDAKHGVLMAGMFNGEYCLRNLESDDRNHFVDGQITGNQGGITNHIQIHLPRRSSHPVAALSSNDSGFRVMDLSTRTFLMEAAYSFPLNCTSVSPDGRLRVMVGDSCNAIITNTETGQIQQELRGHRDFGFSCDWSDDGWTVATGFQDKGVKIWDARRWTDSNGVSSPLCTIRSEMAGVRNLRFSPVGSGQKVLVAAEEADFINIIDAQTFRTKQTVDIFGEIGGVGFTNDGQDLSVLCSDRNRGGLLQLERCGTGVEPFFKSGSRCWKRGPNSKLHANEPYRRRPTMLDSMALF
ncbi:WD40-repeat-containing domain protein [Dactylonectria macrodidyma]|uniref:WD40-repeat-containing domain protein n=1 Tax=Dactylonectria macrodidyma TaxID=307937 RepID=A0A9P9EAF3_9HYPO|nr:WD40-repeat-containing domain protein [Dactylonectria macrodidyma]